MVGGRSATHSPPRRSATAGKTATAVVVAEVVRGEGGKGGCEGGAVGEIYPSVPGSDFDALPSKEDTISLLRDLGHTRVINSLNDVVIDQMNQPWRTFAAIINRSLSGKTSGLEKLCLSRAQILWGMYHQKYVDYVE
ncbi:hypothetical protein Tco_0715986 [Tanacetum coccineum]